MEGRGIEDYSRNGQEEEEEEEDPRPNYYNWNDKVNMTDYRFKNSSSSSSSPISLKDFGSSKRSYKDREDGRYDYQEEDENDEDYKRRIIGEDEDGDSDKKFTSDNHGLKFNEDGGGVNLNDKRRHRALFWKNAAINLMFILSWYLFATLISLYNKWMFSPEHYNFHYPLFVSACHMLVQFTLASLTLASFGSIRPSNRPSLKDYAKKAAPCGIASGLDIGLSNTSLKSVTLSFYTMCKSSSLAFVLLFAFIFKLEKPTFKLTGIILLITAGVILMVSSETKFEFLGMIEVLSASCMGGLRWSLTQILLDKKSMGMNTPIATIFWLAPTMAVVLGLCSLFFEGWNNLIGEKEFFGDLVKSLITLGYVMGAGVMAFLMTVSEYFLIQRTSVVTLSIAGIFKEVGTIFLSTVVFHDVMTPLNISGLSITLFGIGLYNILKYKQNLEALEKVDNAKEGGRNREGGEGGERRYESISDISLQDRQTLRTPFTAEYNDKINHNEEDDVDGGRRSGKVKGFDDGGFNKTKSGKKVDNGKDYYGDEVEDEDEGERRGLMDRSNLSLNLDKRRNDDDDKEGLSLSKGLASERLKVSSSSNLKETDSESRSSRRRSTKSNEVIKVKSEEKSNSNSNKDSNSIGDGSSYDLIEPNLIGSNLVDESNNKSLVNLKVNRDGDEENHYVLGDDDDDDDDEEDQ